MAIDELKIQEILASATADFSSARVPLSSEDMAEIIFEAKTRLNQEISRQQPRTHHEIAQIWNQIVSDFYQQNYWGFPKVRAQDPNRNQRPPLHAYIRTFILPTLVIKTSIVYFGVHYSLFPGHGYGWGLLVSISLSCLLLGSFLWRNRHTESV